MPALGPFWSGQLVASLPVAQCVRFDAGFFDDHAEVVSGFFADDMVQQYSFGLAYDAYLTATPNISQGFLCIILTTLFVSGIFGENYLHRDGELDCLHIAFGEIRSNKLQV